MKIYHGSTKIIDKPMYGLGYSKNDYGKGFYCTEEIELAKEWAVKSDSDGYANEYDFNIDKLNVLYLNNSEYNILNWLALLLKNRSFDLSHETASLAREYILDNFLMGISNYDVIIGYRADDSYFSFAQDFLNNSISLNKLNYAMHLGKLGEQIVLVSKKAFKEIKFIKAHKASMNKYYSKRMNRDKKARADYFSSRNNPLNDLYMMDIIRQGFKNNDKRLYI